MGLTGLEASASEDAPTHEQAVDSWSSPVPGKGLVRDRKGLLATVRNVRRALSTPGYWRRLGLDAFGQVIKWTDWHGPNAGQWRAWTDEDYTAAREQLELDGFAPVGRELIRDVVAKVALDHVFDSAALWLGRLVWDGVPRVDTFCERYLRATGPAAYLRAVSAYWWTAHAGRVLQPGVKADMSPVLVGVGGGQGKTTGVAAIAPAPEFAVRVNLKHPDEHIARLLRGTVVAEFAELRGLRGRDSEDIKDFLSAESDKWTAKYKEFAGVVMRRCVFVGTTDSDEFLSDPVGNFRRWLPVRVGELDVEAIRRDREQLWAEGAARFRCFGVEWQEAQALAGAEHAEFADEDDWADVVRRWMHEPAGGADGGELVSSEAGGGDTSWAQRGFTAREALVFGVGINTANLNHSTKKRMAEILRGLGLTPKRGSRAGGGRSNRIWRMGDTT